jgi:hypothetical protein
MFATLKHSAHRVVVHDLDRAADGLLRVSQAPIIDARF